MPSPVDTFANRLKEAMGYRNISSIDLARITNVSEGAVSQYRSGLYEPRQRRLHRFAEALGVSIPWLMGFDVPMLDNVPTPSKKPKGVKIPVLGRVQAGVPVEAVEEILDWEEITQEMAATGDFFGLQIRGGSMEPRMKEGDVVIVRKQADSNTGDTVVVLINGDEATVKRLKKHEDGSLSLIPTNPAFDPLFYSQAEVAGLPVILLGRVVELRAKF